jgi:L-rhamnose isomerase
MILHMSRGVRRDSDHVVFFDEPKGAIMKEIRRGGFITRTRVGLDFFDASINRIAAWVISARPALKCLLHTSLALHCASFGDRQFATLGRGQAIG